MPRLAASLLLAARAAGRLRLREREAVGARRAGTSGHGVGAGRAGSQAQLAHPLQQGGLPPGRRSGRRRLRMQLTSAASRRPRRAAMSSSARRQRRKARARAARRRAQRRRRESLAALTAGALALPGLAGPAAAEGMIERIGADYNFSRYSEGKISVLEGRAGKRTRPIRHRHAPSQACDADRGSFRSRARHRAREHERRDALVRDPRRRRQARPGDDRSHGRGQAHRRPARGPVLHGPRPGLAERRGLLREGLLSP